MKKIFILSYGLFLIADLVLPKESLSQNIGIGTTQPKFRLHVVDSNVVFSAAGPTLEPPGNLSIQGFGRRMMWYADKAAFRVGFVQNENWDKDSIGYYSFGGGNSPRVKGDYAFGFGYGNGASGQASVSMGYGTNAIGNYSVSLGSGTEARGEISVATGGYSRATGFASTAMGYNSVASGEYSVAMGLGSLAIGDRSTSMGYQSWSQGFASIALGYNAHANSPYSTALGNGTQANGSYALASGYGSVSGGLASVAMGYQSTASGDNSFAVGNGNLASGFASVAIGYHVTANSSYSMALGSYVSTSGFSGCLTIGDGSTNVVMNTFANNGFRARFAGGYRLFTTSDVTIGCFLNAGANSWAPLSDVRLKENFIPVDGESVLKKIAAMPQFTWNYKGQDVKTFRHYGPMAQDFFKAFGKDELGDIGCDTLINQQDFLDVNLIAIQALEKRTAQLQKQLDKAMSLLETYQQQIAMMKEENEKLTAWHKK